MRSMTHEQVSSLVDLVYRGVDRSAVGPMMRVVDPSNINNVQINQMAWSTFVIVLQGVLKNVDFESDQKEEAGV